MEAVVPSEVACHQSNSFEAGCIAMLMNSSRTTRRCALPRNARKLANSHAPHRQRAWRAVGPSRPYPHRTGSLAVRRLLKRGSHRRSGLRTEEEMMVLILIDTG